MEVPLYRIYQVERHFHCLAAGQRSRRAVRMGRRRYGRLCYGRLAGSQRTVPVILLIVLDIIITPALAGHALPFSSTANASSLAFAMDQLNRPRWPGASRSDQVAAPGCGYRPCPPGP